MSSVKNAPRTKRAKPPVPSSSRRWPGRFLRRSDADSRYFLGNKKKLVACIILGSFTLVVLLASIFGEQGMLRVRQLDKERAGLEGKVASLDAGVSQLRRQVRDMKNDSYQYEKAARERLGLVKPGEVVYDFRLDPLNREP